MTVLRTWFRRARGVFTRRRQDVDLDDELHAHLDAHVADNLRAGMTPTQARRVAHLRLGGIAQLAEQVRDRRGVPALDMLVQDCRYGLRTLRRNPGFATVVVITLTLGVGINTLVFAVVNAVIFRSLPIADPNRVAFVQPSNADFFGFTHSFPNYRDLRDRNVTFDGLIGYRMAPMDVEVNSDPRRAWGYLATGNYFDVLGVQPALGRFFHQADDQRPGAAPFAVLSHDLWLAQFHGDPAVIGTAIRINRLPYTIVGVAPAGFTGTEVFFRPKLWVPMMMEAQIEIGNPWLENRATFNLSVAGRLKSGVSPAQATANLNAIAASLAREYPANNRGLAFKLTKPGLLGDYGRSPVQAFTVGLLTLSALVLLIACANLASTLSARGADRAREIAIRLSIGANRARIIRQLLTETLLLSIIAATTGYLIAYVAAAALSRLEFPIELPTRLDIHPDALVFLFTLGTAILAGLAFGLAPARQASKLDASAALKNVDAAIGMRHRWPLRDTLVAVQVALCFVLVAGCLLSLRGLQQALTMPIGFSARGVSMVGFELALNGYDRSQGIAFQQRALDAVTRLPGVDRAAFSDTLPLNINQSSTGVFSDVPSDRQTRPDRQVVPYAVSPGFFETLGIPIRLGRAIDARDIFGAPRVAVVNEAFGRQVLGTSDAVGRHFRFGPKAPLIEIVGVVADGKYRSLTEDPQPAVFVSILQRYNSTTTLVVRAHVPEDHMVAEMRRALAELDSSLPLYSAGSLEQMLGLPLFPNRAAATALSMFGLLAVVLAATGIHGVVSYAVARRRREIGIRVAIGATARDVLRVVLGRIAVSVGAGAVVGMGLSVAIGPLLTQIVYQASPREPGVFVAVSAVVSLIGLVACWAPAVRSLRVEPVVALREE